VSPLTDDAFVEQRRRGLVRFINYIGNHPVLREDADFVAFLKEQGDIASYRKRVPSTSTEEFDTHGNLTDRESQNIPVDIESKAAKLKVALATMLDEYAVLCDAAEQVSQRLVGNFLFLGTNFVKQMQMITTRWHLLFKS
jgi:sorting nexin-8